MTDCIAPSPFAAFSVVRVMRIDMAMMIPIRASTMSTSIIEKPASRRVCRVVLIMGEPDELECTFHARLFATPTKCSNQAGNCVNPGEDPDVGPGSNLTESRSI